MRPSRRDLSRHAINALLAAWVFANVALLTLSIRSLFLADRFVLFTRIPGAISLREHHIVSNNGWILFATVQTPRPAERAGRCPECGYASRRSIHSSSDHSDALSEV